MVYKVPLGVKKKSSGAEGKGKRKGKKGSGRGEGREVNYNNALFYTSYSVHITAFINETNCYAFSIQKNT